MTLLSELKTEQTKTELSVNMSPYKNTIIHLSLIFPILMSLDNTIVVKSKGLSLIILQQKPVGNVQLQKTTFHGRIIIIIY